MARRGTLGEEEAAQALAALGNATRLRIFRLLVRAGPEGATAPMAAGLDRSARTNCLRSCSQVRGEWERDGDGCAAVRYDGEECIGRFYLQGREPQTLTGAGGSDRQPCVSTLVNRTTRPRPGAGCPRRRTA